MKKNIKKVYFIGIGGIGTSALAQYYLAKGAKVSGSDLASSEITKMLKERGVTVVINSKLKAKRKKLQSKIQKLVKEADLVIYSRAVPKNHPELKLARKFKKRCLSYPQALGEITQKYFTIAVCGTHGKSTTAAMISLILIKAGLNPTVILGTKLKELGDSNFRMGGKPKKIKNCKSQVADLKKEILVIEADEHFESFLNYNPNIIVITNIEKDHLDYYKNEKNYIRAFQKFIDKLSENGVLVLNKDDKNSQKLKIKKYKKLKIKKFSLNQKEAKKLKKILKVPGTHNVSNALAALSCARMLGIPDKISYKVLAEYKGSWRRMEEKKIKIGTKKTILVSDYAHHPTEIKVTIEALKEKYPLKKIWLVFQPHQYQRTFYLFRDFIKVLCGIKVEKIILLPIYEVAGRESDKIKKRVSSEILAEEINKKIKDKAVVIKNFQDVKKYLLQSFGGDILVIMGAGDIYELKNFLST